MVMAVSVKRNITMLSMFLLANIFCGQALAEENKQEQSSKINQNLL